MEKFKESNLLIMPRERSELSSRLSRALQLSKETTSALNDNTPTMEGPDQHSAARFESIDLVESGEAAPAEKFHTPAGLVLRAVPTADISFSPYQTRESFDVNELEGLANSIAERGLIQPIVVRELFAGNVARPLYELVTGERRLRAARSLGMERIPTIIQKLTDRASLELSLIENAQRENLNPIEEALGYKRLADEFGVNQTELAKVVGKNRVTITNALRLLSLEPEVIQLLKSGALAAGHGRALLAAESPEKQLSLAMEAAKDQLSVRALEEMAGKDGRSKKPKKEKEEDPGLRRTATRIGKALGIEQVRLNFDDQGRRTLRMTFDTEASWKRFMGRIKE